MNINVLYSNDDEFVEKAKNKVTANLAKYLRTSPLNEIDKIDSDADSSLVTNGSHIKVTDNVDVLSTCLGCVRLRELQRSSETRALLRQAALNSEFQIKRECYNFLATVDQQEYQDSRGNIKIYKIAFGSVASFIDSVPDEQFQDLLTALKFTNRSELDALLCISARLRDEYLSFAHPTGITGPVSVTTLSAAVAELDLPSDLKEDNVTLLQYLDSLRKPGTPFLVNDVDVPI